MSNVIALPTRPTVDAAWVTYQRVCEELQRDPSLNHDATFRARLDKAENDWLDVFALWNKRA